MSHSYRSTGAAILAGAVLGACILAAPSSARPDPAGDDARITCKESGQVTWLNVGIGEEALPVGWQATILFSGCSGPDISLTKPKPVSMAIAGTEQVACDGPVEEHKGTGAITWSDGTTSKISQTSEGQTKTDGSGPGDFPIKIESGHFKGHEAVDSNDVQVEGTCPGVTAGVLTGEFYIF
ncbi:hypothetical protein [Nocardia sp. XZ_19_369]|uniref:hypothetical protein n=1 Tax=Nocardia sp. XZ_19_369 TaxID=2769487 RepID=UPI00188DEF8C|nr:hypothetical protein [Nocardia sp. XZ_19_369]